MKFKLVESFDEGYEGQFFVQDMSAIPRVNDEKYWEKKRIAFKSHKDVGKIVAFKDEPWSDAYEVIGSDGDLYEVKKIGSPPGQIGVVRTRWEHLGFVDDVVKRYTNNFSLDNGEFEETKPYLSKGIIYLLKQHYKKVVKDLTTRPNNTFRFSEKL